MIAVYPDPGPDLHHHHHSGPTFEVNFYSLGWINIDRGYRRLCFDHHSPDHDHDFESYYFYLCSTPYRFFGVTRLSILDLLRIHGAMGSHSIGKKTQKILTAMEMQQERIHLNIHLHQWFVFVFVEKEKVCHDEVYNLVLRRRYHRYHHHRRRRHHHYVENHDD
jgi:hypothetical protein